MEKWNELWNELCYILSENLPTNTNEQLFEKEVVRAFEKLGWSEYNKEISVRESIQIGSSNRITPDLILRSKDKGNLFVVEVKKPSLEIDNPTFKGQLSSYMRIVGVTSGILIGNKIQLFLDGKFFNKGDIVLTEEIEFKRDNEKGLKFVELFSKENYSEEHIEDYAQEKKDELEEIENIKKLKHLILSNNYSQEIIDFLKTELIDEYDEQTIDKVFKDLVIKIEDKNKRIPPVESYETGRAKRHTKFENFNEYTGELSDEKIGAYVQRTFRELIQNNSIDDNEIERLQEKKYSKDTFDINFPFLAKENSLYHKKEDGCRYWGKPYTIKGEIYFACSQWFKKSRPYYDDWLK